VPDDSFVLDDQQPQSLRLFVSHAKLSYWHTVCGYIISRICCSVRRNASA